MGPERIQLADTPPPHCSSCFAAKLSTTHVDFGAAWDGPVISPATYDPDNTPYVPVPIDDLIICEDCVKEAAKLLGLEDADRLRSEIDQQRGVNDNLHSQIAALHAKVAALEQVGRANADLANFMPPRAKGKPKPARRPRATTGGK